LGNANVRLADAGPDYREYRPNSSLAAFLDCFWVRETPTPDTHSVVVPDGCMDIVWMGERDLMIAGPASLPIVVDPPPGTEIAGVRFRPGTAPHVLGYPASDFLDLHVQLDELWPREARELKERAGEQPSSVRKLGLLHQLMTFKRGEGFFQDDETLRHGISLLGGPEAVGVRDLAEVLVVSERHLRRLFMSAVGYGPKKLQRVLRFQRALGFLRSLDQTGKLADIALEAAYADQAHMTREFIELSGLPPTRWLEAEISLSAPRRRGIPAVPMLELARTA
jgi:AraC-like DNA-binding protein